MTFRRWDWRATTSLMLALLALATWAATARAQTGGGYELTWYTVDAGGGVVSGSGYTLTGTAGQADAGEVSGGGYTLSGGLWVGGGHVVYLPIVLW